jgi:hypothetical protein
MGKLPLNNWKYSLGLRCFCEGRIAPCVDHSRKFSTVAFWTGTKLNGVTRAAWLFTACIGQLHRTETDLRELASNLRGFVLRYYAGTKPRQPTKVARHKWLSFLEQILYYKYKFKFVLHIVQFCTTEQ